MATIKSFELLFFSRIAKSVFELSFSNDFHLLLLISFFVFSFFVEVSDLFDFSFLIKEKKVLKSPSCFCRFKVNDLTVMQLLHKHASWSLIKLCQIASPTFYQTAVLKSLFTPPPLLNTTMACNYTRNFYYCNVDLESNDTVRFI